MAERSKRGNILIVVMGIILCVFGIVWSFFSPKEVYDLPYIITIIGIILAILNIKKYISKGKALGSALSYGSAGEKSLKRTLSENGIKLALVALLVVICCISPAFMQARVLWDILAQSSTRIVLALGACLPLLIGGVDLSSGRMVGLSAVIAGSMVQVVTYAGRFYPNMPQIPIIIPIILSIVVCAALGVVSGILVSKFNVNAMIATLAVQVIVYGFAMLYIGMEPNNSQPLGNFLEAYTNLGQFKVFGKINILVFVALGLAVLVWFVLNKTILGKNIYAIGGNHEAAVVSGINVAKYTLVIFIVAGALYGLAGVMESMRTAGATASYGAGYELDAIAACVVGGVSLNGGIGKVSGVIFGVLMFTVITYGLQFIGVDPMWQQVFKGIIIAFAVALDEMKSRR